MPEAIEPERLAAPDPTEITAELPAVKARRAADPEPDSPTSADPAEPADPADPAAEPPSSSPAAPDEPAAAPNESGAAADRTPAGDASGAQAGSPLTWRKVGADLLRPSRTQLLLAVVLCLCALVTVWTVRAKATTDVYSQMSRAELVQLLDQLNSNASSLRSQIGQMQQTKNELQTGADSAKVAAQQSAKRMAELKILAGTAPAQGPGITITITDPRGKVPASMLLDGVEEMRDAGGEVMDLNGQRIVASSWFSTAENGLLLVDGVPLESPYVLTVIGDPGTLEEGARFRGGLVSQVQAPAVGGTVGITRSDRLTITSLYEPKAPEFAKPTEP